MPVINGVYLKDFPALPSSVADANIIPIAISGNQIAYRTTVAGIVTDARITSKLLTGLSVTGSTISATDTILQAFGKVQNQLNGKVSSVGLTMPAAFNVANSPITSAGTLAVTAAGVASQYIRGDGALADFPTTGGGGSSVSYYLNGSVSQGTIGGNTYYEMNKTPVIGTGTDFSIGSDGYIAQFITDANDPASLLIPGGNWNVEMYFSASSSGGTPSFYVEVYKYDGTTFTLLGSSSATPEGITNGTAIDIYYTSVGIPETVLTITDRLAIRVYVTHSGRTITLHTEDNHLSEIVTTFSNGLTTLNGLTKQSQYFATGTTGTDFNISSSVDTHTFNIPDASATARGLITTGTQTIAGAKTLTGALVGTTANFTGQLTLGSTISNGTYTYTLPSATGTLALTSALSDYVPYTGATGDVDLGTNNGITLTDTGSNTSINVTSSSTGQGAILVTKSGNGEGIRVLNGGIGSGFLSANTSTGIGFYINNSSTGIGLKINNDTSATGDPFIYTLNNVSKAKIDYLGNITGVAGTFTGQLTLGSTITNGTYTYTLPSATGTLALTSDIHSAVTLSAIGSTPNANGATLTGQILNLEPASASFGGVVTTGTQTFAGVKTFNSGIVTNTTSTVGVTATSTTNNAIQGSATTGSAIYGSTTGTGTAISGFCFGQAIAGSFSNTTTSLSTLFVQQNGTANVALFQTPTTNVVISNNGSISGVNSLTLSGTLGNGTYTYTLPSATGTLALTSALSSYLPLSGGTLTGALSGTSATFSGDLTIDTNTLYVDSTNDKVGIRNASPLNLFDVKGAIFTGSYATSAGARFHDNVYGINLGGIDASSVGVIQGSAFEVGAANIALQPNGGNVGIGTTSPNGPLDVVGPLYGGLYTLSLIDSAAVAADIGGGIYFGGNYTGTTKTGWAGILGRKDNATDGQYGGYMAFQTRTHGSSPAERMRITSGGDVLVGTTTTDVNTVGIQLRPTGLGIFVRSGASCLQLNRKTSDGIIASFRTEDVERGSISITGSETFYNTSSDYRLKEDFKEINSLQIIDKIKVYNFKWKGSEKRSNGVIAHELAEVLPYAVVGKKDEVDKEGNTKYQGVDYSKLVPIMIAAIQELKAEIDLLKGEPIIPTDNNLE